MDGLQTQYTLLGVLRLHSTRSATWSRPPSNQFKCPPNTAFFISSDTLTALNFSSRLAR